MASIGDENASLAPAQFEKGAAPCLDGFVSNKTYRFNTGWPRGLKKSASKPRNSHLVPNGTPSSRKHVGLIPRPLRRLGQLSGLATAEVGPRQSAASFISTSSVGPSATSGLALKKVRLFGVVQSGAFLARSGHSKPEKIEK